MEIAKIIEYQGNNKTLVWKHPTENFNTMTQLIVKESQEALFFMNGQALDLFGPGRHTLETQNLPLVRKFFQTATGGQTPFHCHIYFINKVEQMSVKWGTSSPIQYVEPTYQIPLTIGASGEMSIRAADSRKLLVKLVGSEILLSQDQLIGYMRTFLNTKIKTYLASVMREQAINIFEVDEHLTAFSDELKARLIPDFTDYGIGLERFYVSTIAKPENDPQYKKFKELHFRKYADIAEANLRQQVGIIDQQTEAQKLVIESQAIAQKREQEGFTFQQERSFDVAEQLAQNEGAGNFSSAGIGLGMVAGVGGAVGQAVGGVFQQSMEPVGEIGTPVSSRTFCENCGKQTELNALFCDQCGSPLTLTKPHCAGCGFVFEREGKFCPKCGAKREGNTNE